MAIKKNNNFTDMENTMESKDKKSRRRWGDITLYKETLTLPEGVTHVRDIVLFDSSSLTLPEGVKINSTTTGISEIDVDFSAEYLSLDSISEILLRSALVCTLLGLRGGALCSVRRMFNNFSRRVYVKEFRSS